MPLVWEDNEAFVSYRGVTVYHTYKNDDVNNRSECWYSLNCSGDLEFDIRDFKEDIPESIPEDRHDLRLAWLIDMGELHHLFDEEDSEIKFEDFQWPDNWRDLPEHLLLHLIYRYDQYIQDNGERYAEGWRPVCMNEFTSPDAEFCLLLEAEGLIR